MRGLGVRLGSAGVALCAWCGLVSGFHRSSAAAEITWACSLGAVLAVDLFLWRGARGMRFGWHLQPVRDPWPRPGRGGSRSALRGVAPWIVLCAVVLAWDVLGLDTSPHSYHLTISALSQAYRPLNAALLLVWILAGIGYEAALARAPVPDPDRAIAPPPDPGSPEPGVVLCAGVLTLGGHPAAPSLLLPSSPPLGVAFWVAVPIAALAVDLTARRSDGRLADAEELIRFVSTARAARIVLVAAWVFAGYHLFAR